MQPLQGLRHFGRPGLLWALAVAFALPASACTIASLPRLSGVGCADPSCNEVIPETRKVIGCTGEACHDRSQPSATEPADGSTRGTSGETPRAVDPPEAPTSAATDEKEAA